MSLRLVTGVIRKESKLMMVEVGASLSGASELDMKVPQRRHYNVMLVALYLQPDLGYCLERRECVCGIRQALFSCT